MEGWTTSEISDDAERTVYRFCRSVLAGIQNLETHSPRCRWFNAWDRLYETIEELFDPVDPRDAQCQIQWSTPSWDERQANDLFLVYVGIVVESLVEGLTVVVSKHGEGLKCRIEEIGRP